MGLLDFISDKLKVLHKSGSIPTKDSKEGFHFVSMGTRKGISVVSKGVVHEIFNTDTYYQRDSVDSMLEDERYYVDAQVQRIEENMSNLGIRKTYPSYAAMQADVNKPIGDNGEAIRGGELVMVVNLDDSSKDGVYRYKIVNSAKSWEYSSGIGIVGELNQKTNSGGSNKSTQKIDEIKLDTDEILTVNLLNNDLSAVILNKRLNSNGGGLRDNDSNATIVASKTIPINKGRYYTASGGVHVYADGVRGSISSDIDFKEPYSAPIWEAIDKGYRFLSPIDGYVIIDVDLNSD